MKDNFKVIVVILLTNCFICQTTQTGFGLCSDATFFQESFSDSVFSKDIRTILLRNLSWELSYPLITLNSDEQLELLFDDLSGQYMTFGYTLIHCDAEWNRSNLSPQEYLYGFDEGIIRESYSSFNTSVEYVHYRLVFPEEDVRPYLSGNYVIVVYDLNNPEKIILTRRFYVLEKLLEVEGWVKRTQPGNNYETGQSIEFSVIDLRNEIRDPNFDLIATVKQNGRNDNSVMIRKPQYIGPDRFDYTFSDQLVFSGGNEFRNFDTKSLKYLSENIAAIDFVNPYYHIYLKPDETRDYKPYFFSQDLDGAYYIDKEKAVDKHRESDYVYVHFELQWPFPVSDEAVYVFGMLSDWNLNASNRMEYLPEKGCYELTLLLKQGWYDYRYIMASPNMEIDDLMIEGSHYETGNTYSIFIYYYNAQKDYHRLTGFLSLKTS